MCYMCLNVRICAIYVKVMIMWPLKQWYDYELFLVHICTKGATWPLWWNHIGYDKWVMMNMIAWYELLYDIILEKRKVKRIWIWYANGWICKMMNETIYKNVCW